MKKIDKFFEKETLELVNIQFYLFFQVALASYPKWANGNQGEKHVALSTISTFAIKDTWPIYHLP
jgi:hypothetical protein